MHAKEADAAAEGELTLEDVARKYNGLVQIVSRANGQKLRLDVGGSAPGRADALSNTEEIYDKMCK